MSSTPTYGFGIVGIGMIADYHAHAIAHVTGARLTGIATRNADNARAFAAKHQVPFVTSSIDELVARPDIDVICVTTPSGAHLEPGEPGLGIEPCPAGGLDQRGGVRAAQRCPPAAR